MKKMLRKLVACVMILLLPKVVCAVNPEKPMLSDYEHATYTLKRLDIIPSDYDTTGNATRMECLSMLAAISSGKDIYMDGESIISPSLADEIVAKYADGNQLSTSEKCIVAYADIMMLLRGVQINDKLYINPEKELTWREAIKFTLRLTCPEFEYYHSGDESFISGASRRGYIYFDDIIELDTVVTDSELCFLINQALHEPVVIHGTMGDFTKYYIDNYTISF